MYDYHSHTDFSPDGRATMEDMVGAAIKAGAREFAITDHQDPGSPYQTPAGMARIDEYNAELDRIAARYNTPGSPIRIVRGIELGLGVGAPNKACLKTVKNYDYDFVLGSIHSARRFEIDMQEYLEPRTPEQAVRDYYQTMLDCLGEYKDFDVLGHINNIDRYLEMPPPQELVMEYSGAALRKLVDMGKGLEINTSSYRHDMGDRTIPSLAMLKLYRELGGEAVTIGCDAHWPQHVGSYWHEGLELLRAAGFTALATYRNRNITYVDI